MGVGEGAGVSVENILLIAMAAASFTRADRSAPTKPGVQRAMRAKSNEPSRRSGRERT